VVIVERLNESECMDHLLGYKKVTVVREEAIVVEV